MGPAHTAPAHTPTPLPERTALLVGARRHLDAVRPHLPANANAAPDTHTDTDTTELVLGPLAPALDTIADHVDRGLPVTVLASGDPGFFGIVRALADRFGPGLLDVRPGVSSVAAAFSRLGLPWDDAVVVSAHGRDPRTAVNLCRAHPKVAVLTGPGAGPAELGAALADTGRTLVVASALGDPERERVEPVTPAEAAARDWGTAVSLVLCLDERRALGGARTVAGIPARPAGWALPEEAFAFRDSMITKFEVRALALARLAPGPGDLVWDVGAGSGSVAVECARLGAAAVAVEKDLDGAERIRGNAASHGVDVRVVRGAAPGALAGLADDPDAVFVGGGGRELPEIVAVCARRARRAVVVALAALDRVPAARAALTDAGLVCDGVLLQSSRLAPLPGEVTRLAATNPVFLLWGLRTPVSSEGVVQ
nr:precorrin-6y C5,15-methyltransferase (decarboxylating) subunit CbiE [Streptomyces corallincola]